jgi:hypothetical protein
MKTSVELLDEFAKAALTGLCVVDNDSQISAKRTALFAYDLALEMLKVREQIINDLEVRRD